MPQSAASARLRVVVVGHGIGRLEGARRLARSLVETTVIERYNYYLFQPPPSRCPAYRCALQQPSPFPVRQARSPP